jgi:hypothetical protein
MESFLYIYNADVNTPEDEINKRLFDIWDFDSDPYKGSWFMCTMFCMRNFKKQILPIEITQHEKKTIDIFIPKGHGLKIISYYMILYLLKHHEDKFLRNYATFINLGCYKDCLNLARMAKERNFSINQIELLLQPMAFALLNDENVIIQARMNNDIFPKISLASKWAPREGKSFSEFIPILKKLCNITGKFSSKYWRQYITSISKRQISVENLLSKKDFNKINMHSLPLKAMRLYESTFINNNVLNSKLNDYHKYTDNDPYYIINSGVDTIMPNVVDNIIDDMDWQLFLDSKTRYSNIFIPVVDTTIKLIDQALTTGILMSLTNNNLCRIAISYAENPTIFDINGRTIDTQKNSIKKRSCDNISINPHDISIKKMLTGLLPYMIDNEITTEESKNINIVIFSDRKPLFIDNLDIQEKYNLSGYYLPKIIYWNLNGHTITSKYENHITHMQGFEPYIINSFLDLDELNPESIPYHKISNFIALVHV